MTPTVGQRVRPLTKMLVMIHTHRSNFKTVRPMRTRTPRLKPPLMMNMNPPQRDKDEVPYLDEPLLMILMMWPYQENSKLSKT